MATVDPKSKHRPSEKHTLDEVLRALQDLLRNDLVAGELPNPASGAYKTRSTAKGAKVASRTAPYAHSGHRLASLQPSTPVDIDAVVNSLKDLITNELDTVEQTTIDASLPRRDRLHVQAPSTERPLTGPASPREPETNARPNKPAAIESIILSTPEQSAAGGEERREIKSVQPETHLQPDESVVVPAGGLQETFFFDESPGLDTESTPKTNADRTPGSPSIEPLNDPGLHDLEATSPSPTGHQGNILDEAERARVESSPVRPSAIADSASVGRLAGRLERDARLAKPAGAPQAGMRANAGPSKDGLHGTTESGIPQTESTGTAPSPVRTGDEQAHAEGMRSNSQRRVIPPARSGGGTVDLRGIPGIEFVTADGATREATVSGTWSGGNGNAAGSPASAATDRPAALPPTQTLSTADAKTESGEATSARAFDAHPIAAGGAAANHQVAASKVVQPSPPQNDPGQTDEANQDAEPSSMLAEEAATADTVPINVSASSPPRDGATLTVDLDADLSGSARSKTAPDQAAPASDDIPVLQDIVLALESADAATGTRAATDPAPHALPAADRVREIAIKAIARLNIELRTCGERPLDARMVDRLQYVLREVLEQSTANVENTASSDQPAEREAASGSRPGSRTRTASDPKQ